MCLPTFVDIHTHIDKAHTCERSRNLNGTLAGADAACANDFQHWTLEDAKRRMGFADSVRVRVRDLRHAHALDVG